MKKLYCLIILIKVCHVSNGQTIDNFPNLLPNGGFEIYSDCPTWYNDLDSAYAWSNPMTNIPSVSGTPDYFNACAISYPVGVPENFQGYQPAHSGYAYAGILLEECSGINYNYREYLQTYFNTPLLAGQCYHFEMYVNLGNNCRFTTDDIGVVISDNYLSGINNHDPLLFIPSIVNASNVVFDTLNWTLVAGDYSARGGEFYLTIGNFNSDWHTSTILYNNSSPLDYIYCYIDDVSLTRCSTSVNINDHEASRNITIYPNPASNYITINTGMRIENAVTNIADIAGKKVESANFVSATDGSSMTIDVSKFAKGMYLLNIFSDTQHFVSKFVKE